MGKELKTYGFNLTEILNEANNNGNEEFAALIKEQLDNLDKAIDNVQLIYDTIAEKHTSTNGENPWNIDAEYVRTYLK